MYTDNNINNVVVFGDWHGDSLYAKNQLEDTFNTIMPDAYLHVGDFGVWPNSSFLKRTNDLLRKQNRELFFVDGNHEDFNIISNFEKDDRGFGRVRSNIFHIPRGHTWSWGGKTLMGLGGATSIDRQFRVKGQSWFLEENISDEEYAKAMSAGNVDVLITHDAPKLPSFATGRFSAQIESESAHNRDIILEVAISKNVSINVHGHHHKAYTDRVHGTTVIGLAENYSPLTLNRVEINLSEI